MYVYVHYNVFERCMFFALEPTVEITFTLVKRDEKNKSEQKEKRTYRVYMLRFWG